MPKNLSPVILGAPWVFSSSGNYAQWAWTEPGNGGRGAFNATIVRSGVGFTWTVRVPGGALLGRGSALDKDACEERVFSCIGKAFANLTLPLVGVMNSGNRVALRSEIAAAASLYELAGGPLQDLREFSGRLVDLHLVNGTAVTGMLRIGEWSLVLDTGDSEMVVHPAHVTSIALVP